MQNTQSGTLQLLFLPCSPALSRSTKQPDRDGQFHPSAAAQRSPRVHSVSTRHRVSAQAPSAPGPSLESRCRAMRAEAAVQPEPARKLSEEMTPRKKTLHQVGTTKDATEQGTALPSSPRCTALTSMPHKNSIFLHLPRSHRHCHHQPSSGVLVPAAKRQPGHPSPPHTSLR